MLQGPDLTVERARKLRKDMSLPEVLLWRELRRRPGGLKFRRQHPAGPYVADFFCQEARLVIEIDGEAHERGDRSEHDAKRDAWFVTRRFPVLRIPAAEVLANMEAVVRGIVAQANLLPQREGDQAKAGGGVSVAGRGSETAVRAEPLTTLRQASPATSPQGGGL